MLTLIARLRRRLNDSQGFAAVEAIVAIAVMAVGLGATVQGLAASNHSADRASDKNTATRIAQQEMERLQALSYSDLKLSSVPTDCYGDLSKACGRVWGPGGGAFGAYLSLASGSCTGGPFPSETCEQIYAKYPFYWDTSGPGHIQPVSQFNVAGVKGEIARYITWRDEKCSGGSCDGFKNTKRVTVAVTLDPQGTTAARRPAWISTIVRDPAEGVVGGGPGGGPLGDPDGVTGLSTRHFYLYDKACGSGTDTSYPTNPGPTASHPVRSTAVRSASETAVSECANTIDPTMRPDLMGATPTPNWISPPTSVPVLHDYSSDATTESYPGGLALIGGTTAPAQCPTTPDETFYPTSETATTAALRNKWKVHAWASPPFTATTTVKDLSLSLFTSSIGGAGSATICATLLLRDESLNYSSSDKFVRSWPIHASNWPYSTAGVPGHLSRTLTLPDGDDLGTAPDPLVVPARQRVYLVLSVPSSSMHNVSIAYDHPRYPSSLLAHTCNTTCP